MALGQMTQIVLKNLLIAAYGTSITAFFFADSALAENSSKTTNSGVTANFDEPRCGRPTPISIKRRKVVISEKMYSCGGDISVVADVLEFRPGGLLHSGTRKGGASRRCRSVPSGRDSGNIEIVAREVVGLNVSSNGQQGGNCTNDHHVGGYGGDGGNITLKYLTSNVSDIGTPNPSGVRFKGGAGGFGAGRNRNRQSPSGVDGSYAASQFPTELAFYQFALPRIPSLTPKILQDAELHYLANQLASAKLLLELISSTPLSSSSLHFSRQSRAANLLRQISDEQNIFGYSQNWAKKHFHPNDPRLLRIDEITTRIEGLTADLTAIERWVEYREMLAHDAQQAEEAKDFEIASLTDGISNYRRNIDDANRQIDGLKQKINRGLEHVSNLEGRIQRLISQVENLPQAAITQLNHISNGINIITDGLDTILGAFDVAARDQESFNPLTVLNGISKVLRGASQTASAFEKLLSLRLNIESQIQEMHDKIFRLTDDIEQDKAKIKSAASIMAGAQQSIKHNQERIVWLGNNWSSRNLRDFEEMLAISNRVYLHLRMSLAEELFGYWRYADFVLDHKPNDQLFAGAPGGYKLTMTASHLRLLKTRFRQKINRARPFDVIPGVKACLNLTTYLEERKSLVANRFASFVPLHSGCFDGGYFRNARIRAATVTLEDKSGNAISALGKIVHRMTGNRFAPDGSRLKFEMEPSKRRISSGVKSEALALENLDAIYNLGEFVVGDLSRLGRITMEFDVMIPADSVGPGGTIEKRRSAVRELLNSCVRVCR